MRSAEGGEPPRELSRRAAACLWCQRLHLGEHSYYIWASTAVTFGRAQLPVLGHRSSERRCRGARRLVALMLLSYSK